MKDFKETATAFTVSQTTITLEKSFSLLKRLCCGKWPMAHLILSHLLAQYQAQYCPALVGMHTWRSAVSCGYASRHKYGH